MPYKKGECGNPGGRPKENPEIKELARQHAPAAIRALVAALGDKRQRVAAAAVLLDRGFGKPNQTMDITHRDAFAEILRALNGNRARPVIEADSRVVEERPDEQPAGVRH